MRFAALTLAIGLLLAGTAAGATARAETALVQARSSRILYSSDWTGPTEIYVVDPSRRAPIREVTFGREAGCLTGLLFACGFIDPMPSPDGRFVLYRSVAPYLDTGALWIARANGRNPRLLATPQGCAMWAPDSKHIGYMASGGMLHVVSVDGSNGRVVAAPPRWWNDCSDRAVGRTVRSPDGRWIAFAATDGIRLTDLRTPSTRFSRLLTHDRGFDLTWSPDSRSLAYIVGTFANDDIASSDLRVVSLRGRVHTVVAADHAYGGRIASLAWTRPRPATRYRAPEPAPSTLIAPDSVHADGLVDRLVADGDRVAYVSCFRVHVWTPAARTDVTVNKNPLVQSSPPSLCVTDPGGRNFDFGLALAGDRVAYATRAGGLSYRWSLATSTVGSTGSAVLASGNATLGSNFPYGAAGMLAGSGSLLVYSFWHTALTKAAVTDAEVRRVDAGGCPCRAIASSAGPLVPLDVEGGKIVIADDKAIRVIDPQGAVLLSIPVSPLAAQLSGTDLVLLQRGQLLDYDASTGEFRRAWALPDVPSGAETGDPNGFRAIPPGVRLVLEDAAHGLVAYVLDEQVHVLRLVDGKDEAVGPGRLARFVNAGLVYADGARIRLVPFDRLPLR